MNENVEHVDRSAFVIACLAGCFAINSSDNEIVFFGENRVQEYGKSRLKLLDGILG